MTREELDAIRQREQAAKSPLGYELAVPGLDAYRLMLVSQSWLTLADVQFLVAAHADVLSLLAEVERLRGLLREWSSLAFKQVIGPPLCPLCYGRGEQYDTIQHKPDCLFERTRAALEDDHA